MPLLCAYITGVFPSSKNVFNWRIIASQYCAGFCHTTLWISYKYTHILSVWSLLLARSHPSRSSQGTELSSLCFIQQLPASSLFIHGSVHVSMLRLQCGRPGFNPWVGKIPWRRERLPTPVSWPGEFHGLYSPWGHKRVGHDWATLGLPAPSSAVSTGPFYICASPSLPSNSFISTLFLDPNICVNIWYLFFSFWLTSLCITGSRFIHLSSTDSNLFLLMGE